MKDSLFEILLGLFEKTLTQLKENRLIESAEVSQEQISELFAGPVTKEDLKMKVIKPACDQSMRVFTMDEQNKLTKESYQFIMRLMNLEIVAKEDMESILHELLFSESRIVGVQETKWVIRSHLSGMINTNQLAFLDLVLYQKEDEYSLH